MTNIDYAYPPPRREILLLWALAKNMAYMTFTDESPFAIFTEHFSLFSLYSEEILSFLFRWWFLYVLCTIERKLDRSWLDWKFMRNIFLHETWYIMGHYILTFTSIILQWHSIITVIKQSCHALMQPLQLSLQLAFQTRCYIVKMYGFITW